jgi:hypothetical protein
MNTFEVTLFSQEVFYANSLRIKGDNVVFSVVKPRFGWFAKKTTGHLVLPVAKVQYIQLLQM